MEKQLEINSRYILDKPKYYDFWVDHIFFSKNEDEKLKNLAALRKQLQYVKNAHYERSYVATDYTTIVNFYFFTSFIYFTGTAGGYII